MADGSIDTLLRTSRPTFTVAGADNAPLSSALLSLVVAENTQGMYRCEAKFGNLGPGDGGQGAQFLYFDRKTLEFGKSFQVKLGTDTVFDGRISALEAHFPDGGAPPEITALAEDRFQDLRMTRRTMSYSDVSDADVIRQVATRQGLTADVDVAGPSYKVLAQVNQSDLAFLRERARAVDAELWMTGATLHAKKRTGRGTTTVTLGMNNELRELTVIADLAGQRSSVSVGGWDVAGKSALKEQATDDAIRAELGGDASGAQILTSAQFGDRKECLVHTVPLSRDEARARAESFFQAGARRFLRARGVAQTDARLRVGAKVDIRNVGPLFSGAYYLVDVCLTFDGARGLRTEFVAERPGIGQAQ
jgi:phage protein D